MGVESLCDSFRNIETNTGLSIDTRHIEGARGTKLNADTFHCVIDAQLPVFPRSKNQSATELLIEISSGNIDGFVFIVEVVCANSVLAIPCWRIPRKGFRQIGFVLYTCCEIAKGVV